MQEINKGQILWQKSQQLIPGGNMLLSKRPDLFAPKFWPTYYKKAKGCYVWDLEGKKYTDMSIMGIGTNVLGYGNERVDEAVMKAVKDGNMSTFNCAEEVELAEELVKLHPWASMAKFARAGGEANAIAIRIARAFSGRDKVVFCGYHGWHDWYISAGSNDGALSDHLFEDIQTKGVPRSLAGTSIPFKWNDIDNLVNILDTHKGEVGVIKMEVTRNIIPEIGFLKSVRKLCDEKNIVLIFDECTSGFRETFGGLHLKFNIDPDLAVFGKALGNGYAITAVLGREDVMKASKESFISSTFWTERIGNVAALAALKEMEKSKSWNLISNLGRKIQAQWKTLANKYELEIEIGVIPAIATFSFKSKNALEYKTYLTREFLKKGYLASNLLFVSTEHLNIDLQEYFDILESIFKIISMREKGELTQKLVNDNELCGDTFKRLN